MTLLVPVLGEELELARLEDQRHHLLQLVAEVLLGDELVAQRVDQAIGRIVVDEAADQLGADEGRGARMPRGERDGVDAFLLAVAELITCPRTVFGPR